MKNEIVICRMFQGRYLKENLGHEIINLVKADNGKNYVYLTDLGTFGKGRNIESIVFAQTRTGLNEIEVLGVATGLRKVYNPEEGLIGEDLANQQIQFIRDNRITYGGANLVDIFRNSEQQEVFISFEAEKVVLPHKPIYIKMGEKQNSKDSSAQNTPQLVLHGVKLGQTLKNYVAEGSPEYDLLSQIIQKVLSSGKETTTLYGMARPRDLCYLDVCHRGDDENAYSNAIAYFANKYPKLAVDVFNSVSGCVNPCQSMCDLVVKREVAVKDIKGRIDLLFQTRNCLVVIENKIKAGIHKDQLERYEEIAKEYAKENGISNVFFLLLIPDYSPLIKGQYGNFNIVTYSSIYNYLNRVAYNGGPTLLDVVKDPLYVDFVRSLAKHSQLVDDTIKMEMLKRFLERIDSIK